LKPDSTPAGNTPEALLGACGIDRFDARLLLAHASGLSRVQLLTRSQDPLPAAQADAARALFARRAHGEPVAYLLGRRDFHALTFAVSPEVLIPRPETELLVELASERITRPGMRVLDLGTGSGAIAVTLAHLHADAALTATDFSEDALKVARSNAQANKVRLETLHGSWYAATGERTFDLIVSNPPYIAAGDPHLSQGDLRFEPSQALTDGSDGLSALAAIIDGAPRHLAAGGWLLMEHGYDQAAQVRRMLDQHGFEDVQSWQDLAGIERVSGGRLPGQQLAP
jgi:release factor glutamine methyltransferase